MDHDGGGGSNLLTQKIGPLPVVVWVIGASGLVFLFIVMKNSSSANNAANNQTNQVSALAPTEAEAFGTMEQQQQDVTNALTTLGNNQSALGGSMSTLTGIVTDQGTYAAAQFQNLLNGQQQLAQTGSQLLAGQGNILSGQATAATNAANYQQTLSNQLSNYYSSLFGEVGSGFGGMTSQLNALSQTVTSDAQAQQLGYANLASFLNAQQSQIGTIQSWVDEIKARLQTGNYSAPENGPSGQGWQTAATAGPSVAAMPASTG